MAHRITSLMEAQAVQGYATEDAVLFAHGYRPEYCYPTAKDRKRIAVIADPKFDDFRMMVDQLETLTARFDDPIIYCGACVHEDTSYGNCLIVGWAKYNHYDHYSLMPTGGSHRRNERLVSLCTHLIAFHNGEDIGVQSLIELAREEQLRIKIIPFTEK